jgi:hypothetical protein
MQVNQGNHSYEFKNLNTNSHQIESGILHNDCDCSSPQRAIVDNLELRDKFYFMHYGRGRSKS